MTLGRENDALSSSHPGPSSLNSPSGCTPGYPSPSGQPRPTMWHPIIPARRRGRWGKGCSAAWIPATDVTTMGFWIVQELLLKRRLKRRIRFKSQSCSSSSSQFTSVCLTASFFAGRRRRHHLADDSGIPISNYKQDLGSIRAAW